MNKKYNIDLSWDVVDEIVLDQLKSSRASLAADLDRPVPGVFVMDVVIDKQLIQDHIDAFDLVISYFSIPTISQDQWYT